MPEIWLAAAAAASLAAEDRDSAISFGGPVTDSNSATDASGSPEDGDPSYSYKPSLAGGPVTFWLRRDGLEWNVGRRSGVIRYDRIRWVRLSYRPATLQSHRFTAE